MLRTATLLEYMDLFISILHRQQCFNVFLTLEWYVPRFYLIFYLKGS